MKDTNTGPACKKCNDTGYIVIRSHNGRYARPGPVPDDARGYAEARCFECLANPGGFDGPTGPSDMAVITHTRRATEIEIAAEMDRRGSVIECLEQKIARSDSIMKDIRRLLVRCHDRIHSLPRTSDTELAASIEQLLGRIASELGAPRNG